MVVCDKCGASIEEKDALVHTGKEKEQEILCRACFQKETGVDYDTFAHRKEQTKQTLFAVILCSIATIYAFTERGAIYGCIGLVLTALVYFWGSKAK